MQMQRGNKHCREREGDLSYNARLTWALTNKCNFNCVYCINVYPDKKNAELPLIDIPALLKFLERSKKIFRINFTGGEPFLVPNLIEACLEITKKHYVSFNTNLTNSRVKDFADKIDPKRVVCITATAHIKELERCRLLNAYVCHILMLQKKDFNVKNGIIARPSLMAEVDKYKQLFSEKGIELEFTPFIGMYKNKPYPFSYTDQELEIFGLDKRVHLERYYYQRKRVCNSGYNAAVVDTKGDIYICDRLKIKIGNIYGGITFRKRPLVCPFKFCGCPIAEMEPSLLQKAMEECGNARDIIGAYLLLICKEMDRGVGLVGLFLRHRCPNIYFSCKRLQNKCQVSKMRTSIGEVSRKW